jgi:hypothetical protein
MQVVREASLRPSAAERYPYLPVRMWTEAEHLADLVAEYRGLAAKVRDRTNRVLSDADFLFRDGDDRGSQRIVG